MMGKRLSRTTRYDWDRGSRDKGKAHRKNTDFTYVVGRGETFSTTLTCAEGEYFTEYDCNQSFDLLRDAEEGSYAIFPLER